ncbi:hypothetical protein TgHK011_004257 [Trichoderma gracile]|nr:hypothetical protein TgHK011_004257 [Trichoderma gracile]
MSLGRVMNTLTKRRQMTREQRPGCCFLISDLDLGRLLILKRVKSFPQPFSLLSVLFLKPRIAWAVDKRSGTPVDAAALPSHCQGVQDFPGMADVQTSRLYKATCTCTYMLGCARKGKQNRPVYLHIHGALACCPPKPIYDLYLPTYTDIDAQPRELSLYPRNQHFFCAGYSIQKPLTIMPISKEICDNWSQLYLVLRASYKHPKWSRYNGHHLAQESLPPHPPASYDDDILTVPVPPSSLRLRFSIAQNSSSYWPCMQAA